MSTDVYPHTFISGTIGVSGRVYCASCQGLPSDMIHDHETDPIVYIDTPALRRMADRAYWAAVAAWQDYRADDENSTREHPAAPGMHVDLARMLRASAESADYYYDRLTEELNRRDAS